MYQPSFTTITLSSTPNSQQSLYTLLSGIQSQIRKVASFVLIQADVNGGSTAYAVGQSNVAPQTGSAKSGTGTQLFASQTLTLGPFESNLLHLDEIYVSASAASAIMNVVVVTR